MGVNYAAQWIINELITCHYFGMFLSYVIHGIGKGVALNYHSWMRGTSLVEFMMLTTTQFVVS